MDPKNIIALNIIGMSYLNLACNPEIKENVNSKSEELGDYWEIKALFFSQAIQAFEKALEHDDSQEDIWNEAGLAYMSRALVFWKQLIERKDISKEECIKFFNIMKKLGINWVDHYIYKEEIDIDTTHLPKICLRAIKTDLYEARNKFNCGMSISPTKNRSMFWMAILDGIIDSVINEGFPFNLNKRICNASPTLRVLGISYPGVSLDQLVKNLNKLVQIYNGSIFLRTYLPDVLFAYAVVFWEFIPRNLETQKLTLKYLELAKKTAQELQNTYPNLSIYSIIRCWGYLQLPYSFIEDIKHAINSVNKAPQDNLEEGESLLVPYIRANITL